MPPTEVETLFAVASLRITCRTLGVEAVVVRCASEGEATVRSVGGLAVYGIGFLEDLTALLARTASVA